MRGYRFLPLALVAAACVTRVTGSAIEFATREAWRPCVRERLEGLGYRVTPTDSLAPELRAVRNGLSITAAARADSAGPILRLTVEGGTAHAEVDSLVIYCSRMAAGAPR